MTDQKDVREDKKILARELAAGAINQLAFQMSVLYIGEKDITREELDEISKEMQELSKSISLTTKRLEDIL